MRPFRLIALLLFIIPAASVSGIESTTQPGVLQVSTLRASFRNGQTFLTWQELPLPNTRYRIYRSTQPLRMDTQLTTGTLVGTVSDHTSFNWMASIDREELAETRPASAPYKIPTRVYYTIEDGRSPLSDTTGLFVYTAKAKQTAYYAVTAIVGELENLAIADGENSLLLPISEEVKPVQPVRQNGQDYVHWTDNVGTDLYPAMSSVASVPYMFRLTTPEWMRNAKEPLDTFPADTPLVGRLNSPFNTPAPPPAKAKQTAAKPHEVAIEFDSPELPGPVNGFNPYPLVPGGWHGYSNAWGTDLPEEEKRVIDYHARRVIWGLVWAQQAFPIDSERVSLEGNAEGGLGALAIAFKYPERLAAVRANLTPSDLPAFHPHNLLKDSGNPVLPLLIVNIQTNDSPAWFQEAQSFIGWAQERKVAFQLIWSREENAITRTPQVTSFRRNRSFPAIADCTANDDPATDKAGMINAQVNWNRDTIGDETYRCEMTLDLTDWSKADKATADVTPRRLQNFILEPGETVAYKVLDATTDVEMVSGNVVADPFGRVTIKAMPLTVAGTRLVLEKIRPTSRALTTRPSRWPAAD